MTFRRPLTLPALSVTAIIFTAENFGFLIAFVSATVFSGAALWIDKGTGVSCGRAGPQKRTPVIFMTIVLVWSSLIHLYAIDSEDRLLPKLDEKATEVRGAILDIDVKSKGSENRMMILVRTETPCEKERILVNCPARDDLSPGDRISVTGKVKLPKAKTNPNTFDYRNYLRSMGVYTTMYSEKVSLIGAHSSSIRAVLYRTKTRFLKEIEIHAGKNTSDMMRAILFGDKGSLDEDIQETFRMNGTAHILAVSGLHVGMIYALILALWNRTGGLFSGTSGRGRGWLFLISTGSALSMYAVIAGFAPSVVRAVLMILLHIFAGFSGRYYDLKSAGMAVYLFVLMKNPLMLFQSGFQMSFLAIMSLSLVMPYIRRFLSGTLLAGVSIQIGLMPYMIYQFNWLSWPSALINIPVIFIAGLLVPLGMVAFLTSAGIGIVNGHGDMLIDAQSRALSVLTETLIRLNDICCIEGLTAVRVSSPHVFFVFVFYLGLVAFGSESGRLHVKRSGRRAVVTRAMIVLIISMIFGLAVDDGYRNKDLIFVDVGQGDCMHIRVNDGPVPLPGRTRNYLIDGGGSENYEVGKKTLMPYLLKNGVTRIDGAFVSHLHTDHYRGICELAREGMVDKLYLYESNRLKLDRIRAETGMVEDDVIFLKKGDRIVLSKTLTGRVTAYMDVLWPEEKSDAEYRDLIENEEDENASSLILRAVVEGVSLLATGDLGEEGEKEILGAYPRPSTADNLCSDILKVGHHGSRYSTCNEFLDAVSPSLAVIQVSKGNTYGHPTPEVLKKLADRGIPTYRNDLQGAIGFSLSGGSIKEARTMIE